jgi:2-iminobutanoate/2-iminopropanoate deaminase
MEIAMEKTIIKTDQAPPPVGPYSQGVMLDGWMWTSGQVALDPGTGKMVGSDAASQADQALRNLDAILRSAGSSLTKVVRTTVFLTNMEDFSAVNQIYARYFPKDFPARSCVEVAKLPLGALVEIDAVARI